MESKAVKDRFRNGLEAVVALETRLDQSLAQALAATNGCLEAPTFIGSLQSLATGHREALQAHLRQLGETRVASSVAERSAAFDTPPWTQPGEQTQQAVAALRALAMALTETVFAYAVLHTAAHRAYHIGTADLAEDHRKRYLACTQAVHQALGDVVVQELQEAGHTCRCECPSCSPGICLCWHVHAYPDITGPVDSTKGIVVRAPRAASNADRAGLHHGDVILAVDDEEVPSYQHMLDRMRDHRPGEGVSLRVRRVTGDLQDVIITR